MIIDSHCHLHYPPLLEDIDNVMDRAKRSKIDLMLTVCTRLGDIAKIREISQKYQSILYSVGIHPHEVKNDGIVSIEKIIDMTNNAKAIGIGETGLDFYYDHSPREEQILSFKNHIIAASATKLPIIIHTRSAEEETIKILSKQQKENPFSGVVHCFSGSKQLADAALDLGLYISISGIITFKNAQNLRDTIASVPLTKILIETDAPYLAPVPMRGKTNEPSYIGYVIDTLTTIYEVDRETIIEQTRNNFFDLFAKAKLYQQSVVK